MTVLTQGTISLEREKTTLGRVHDVEALLGKKERKLDPVLMTRVSADQCRLALIP